ncbi:MAG TPA: hypothetical protein DDZ83_03955, partial [Nitrospinae bacterium]|nr:hypothetical protein [Nitrospinota bacterium]
NFGEGFERVVLLIESQEAETIAGALTLAAPLKFRGDLVAAAPPAPQKTPPAPPPPSPPRGSRAGPAG